MSKSTICVRCFADKIHNDVWGLICPNCHPCGPNYKVPPAPVAATAATSATVAAAPQNPRLRTHTVEQVAKLLHVSRRTVFNILKRGGMRKVKVGTRTIIRDADLVAFISRGGGQQ